MGFLKTYRGDVEITKDNQAFWVKKLKKVTKITGSLIIDSQASLQADALQTVGADLIIDSQASLPALQTVGADLRIDCNIGEDFERRLWETNQNKNWSVSEHCSEWLLSQNGKLHYYINHIEFDRSLFNAVRHDALSALEILQIKNIEQRRVAYERMNKTKIADLPDLKTLDETTDAYGHPMRIITFKADGIQQPFGFLHCVCPSTGREYYLETDQKECLAAKNKSFGLTEDVNFIEEW